MREVVVLKKVLICVYSIAHCNTLQLSFWAYCVHMYINVCMELKYLSSSEFEGQ